MTVRVCRRFLISSVPKRPWLIGEHAHQSKNRQWRKCENAKNPDRTHEGNFTSCLDVYLMLFSFRLRTDGNFFLSISSSSTGTRSLLLVSSAKCLFHQPHTPTTAHSLDTRPPTDDQPMVVDIPKKNKCFKTLVICIFIYRARNVVNL